MKITENNLRKIISKTLKKESNIFLEADNKNDSNLKKIKDFVDKKIIYIYSGKKGSEVYIEKPKSAIKRFAKLRSDLQKYLQENWKYSDVVISYHGITRSMKK